MFCLSKGAHNPMMIKAAHRLANVAWRLIRFEMTSASKIGRPRWDGHIFSARKTINWFFVPWMMLSGTRSLLSVPFPVAQMYTCSDKRLSNPVEKQLRTDANKSGRHHTTIPSKFTNRETNDSGNTMSDAESVEASFNSEPESKASRAGENERVQESKWQKRNRMHRSRRCQVWHKQHMTFKQFIKLRETPEDGS